MPNPAIPSKSQKATRITKHPNRNTIINAKSQNDQSKTIRSEANQNSNQNPQNQHQIIKKKQATSKKAMPITKKKNRIRRTNAKAVQILTKSKTATRSTTNPTRITIINAES